MSSSLLVATPAQAGGPTSVILVNPVTGQASALYATDTAYEQLADLVGAFSADPTTADDRTAREHAHGAALTVTWLIHDVYVWRVDRIYVDAKGGPWIASQTALGDPAQLFDSPIEWHTSKDGPALITLLAGLSVSRGGADAAAPAAQPDPDGATAAMPSGATPAADPGDASGPHTWLWALAGVVLGVGLALTVVRGLPAVRRSRAGRLEPEGDAQAWTVDADGVRVPLDTLTSPRR